MVEEKRFFQLVTLQSVVFSVGGVMLPVFTTIPAAHGNRGGAIAVGLSLLALFGTRNYPADVYTALTHKKTEFRSRLFAVTRDDDAAAEAEPVVTTDQKFAALEKFLALKAEGESIQNFYLAVATGIGTFFWGFGDLLSECLK